MQKLRSFWLATVGIWATCILDSCVRPLKDVRDYYPEVEVISYSPNIDGSITIHGRIVSNGDTEVQYAGFSMTSEGIPTGTENQKLGDISINDFSVNYTGISDLDGSYFELDPSHTYYVRAFAVNEDGYTLSETFELGPWEIPTVEAPCIPPVNTYNVGSGNIPASVSGPNLSAGQYVYELSGGSGNVSLRTNQLIHAGIYTTSSDAGFMDNNEIYISYTNFNFYVISSGALVYVNETAENVFEVTVCEAPFNMGGLDATFSTRFIID